MKSRSESDLSQPESDEEGYTLVEHTHTLTHIYCTSLSHDAGMFVFMSCIPRAEHCVVIGKLHQASSLFLLQSGRRNVDLDLAFSHKKRGKDPLLNDPSNVASKDDAGLSLSSIMCYSCLSVFSFLCG